MRIFDQTENKIINLKWWVSLVAVLFLVIVVGLVGVVITRKQVDDLERAKVLKRAETASLVLDGEMIKRFKVSGSFISSIEFTEIREKLIKIKEVNSDCRFVYLYEVKDGSVVFLIDAEEIGSKDYSSPGDIYKNPTKRDLEIFKDGISFVEGPIADKWGEWVSVLVSVRDDQGRIVAILGMDIDASEWKNRIIRDELLSVFLAIFCLVVFFLISIWLLGRKVVDNLRKDRVAANLEFKNVLNSIGDFVYSYDENDNFKSANLALCSYLGKDETVVLGKKWSELDFPPENIVEWKRWHEQVRREKKSGRFISRLTLNNQSKIYEVGLSPIFDCEDSVKGIAGVTRDITEEVALREELEKAKSLYENLVEQNSDPIFCFDQQGRYTFVNKAFALSFEVGPKEIMGKKIEDMFPSEEATKRNQIVRSVFQKGVRETLEAKVMGTNGLDRYFLTTINPVFKEDKIDYLLCISKDMTEIIEGKKELEKSEEKFRRFFTSPLIGMAMMDGLGKWQMVNDKFGQIVGYTQEELLEMDWCSITEEKYVDVQKRLLKEVISNKGTGLTLEKKYIHKNGQSVDVEVSIEMIYDSSDLICMIAMIQDLTAKKKANEEKDFLQKQLNQAQKLEAIGFLAAGIAHDFNNILTGIMGYAELIRMDLPENSTYYDFLSKILSSSKRAKDLVSQIQSFTRQQSEDVQPVNIVPVTKELVNFMRSTIPASIEVVSNIELDEITIGIEPSKYHQVLMNMMTNAAHACKEKGSMISINLKKIMIDDLLVDSTGLRFGEYALLTIQDDGCGMDSHIAERVFYPFFTTKKQGEGTGLGLSVVHGIVGSAGGSVQVESKVDYGTIFRIFLPIKTGDFKENKIEQNKGLMGKEKILLVDDEEQILGSVGMSLRRFGYDILEVTDPVEAINICESEDFDLIITDYAMPGLDGFKMLKKIRQFKSLKSILCSGYAEMLNKEYMLEMGICDSLLKPYTAMELAKIIREVMDSK